MSFFFRRGNRSTSQNNNQSSVASINSTSDDEEEVATPSITDQNKVLISSPRFRSSSLSQQQNNQRTDERIEIAVEGDDSGTPSTLSKVDINRVEQSSGLLEIPSSAYKRKISFSDESSPETTPTKTATSDNLYSSALTTKGNYKVTPNSNRRVLNKIPSSLRLDPKTFTRKNSTPQLFTSPRNPLSLSLSKLNETKISSENISNVVLSSRSSSQLVVIIEIGRKYFKCGISGDYCPRVVLPVPYELSEMLCKCKNHNFNIDHMKQAFSSFEKDIGSCNIETDVIFDEYTRIGFGNSIEDDAYYEEKLSHLLGKLLKRIFIDELKLHLDSIDHVVILENVYSLHENLVRRTVEDMCNRKRFSKLKGIKFINAQSCALIPSSCSVKFQTANDSNKLLSPPILSLTSRKGNEEMDVNGLVIDCGFSECKIVPVLFGCIVQAGVVVVDTGSKHILRRLKDNLMKMNPKESLTPQHCDHVDLNKLFYEHDEGEMLKYYSVLEWQVLYLNY
ncbi:predicted protein [Naegleria gruberi]|uniref:Predicted protein n=1 Tax=Naegleria gruberi TaxID=5762 RepID=D2V2F1_NAEGR|nr:uncharacterized protein NAEGRDRAFT_46153 [Naegleria gruberi]EFC48888.1 predicted protein [Naegleria gruberi]|eukprot:XP_002681632.1 predicted protein [Naegleria gruberi strain NEG-M]